MTLRSASLALWGLLFAVGVLYAQATEQGAVSEKTLPQKSTYIRIAPFMQIASFRDFATSPLRYSGGQLGLGLGLVRTKNNSEGVIGLSLATATPSVAGYSFGGVFVSESSNLTTTATLTTLDADYTLTFGLNKLNKATWNKGRWTFRAGGQLANNLTIRNNSSLGNSALGLDMFSRLSLALKAQYNFTRASEGGRWIVPKKGYIDVYANIPVFYTNWRNGNYVYAASDVTEENVLNSYKFYLYSGYQFSSGFGINKILSNGNQWRIAYQWNLLIAGKKGSFPEMYQFASHNISFALVFNASKKRPY